MKTPNYNAAGAKHEGRRLLVLDDDASVGETVCAIADRTGIQARWATSAQEFFAQLALWEPQYIIIDLVMPDIDGVEMLRRLALVNCEATVIVASGLGTRVLEAAGRVAAENGLKIAGVLHKPFTSRSLRQLLAAAVPGANHELHSQHPAAKPEITHGELEEALRHGRVVTYYQPKISCFDGSLTGFEALARWEDPEFGLISPDYFIPFAEASGQILPLTDYVVHTAVRWLADNFPVANISIAVNISARVLEDTGFSARLMDACLQYGIPPGRITLEITESSTVQNPVTALEVLTQFRIKGFQLSIDDFGTGYSSLSQLAGLPFSQMKIDKTFVLSARKSAESRKIATSIVRLAHALGLQVTGEGVEDEWSLRFLQDIGCDSAQGFLFAPALSPESAVAWVRTWRPQEIGCMFRGMYDF